MEEVIHRIGDLVDQLQGGVFLERPSTQMWALAAVAALALCWFIYRNLTRQRTSQGAKPVVVKEVGEIPSPQVCLDSPEPIVAQRHLQEAPSSAMMRGMAKTRSSFLDRLKGLFGVARRVDSSTLDDLEELLILSDVGARCAASLVQEVKAAAQGVGVVDEAYVKGLLKEGILKGLQDVSSDHPIYKPSKRPFVVLVVGVNGVGKTTTVAKLAARYNGLGKKVLLVAADTFRAAAVAQLQEWGDRLGVRVVSGPEDAKPATVVFDGMVAALDIGADVVLIDTAGRLHTKSNLMQELEGIRNVIRKHIPEAPHETVLVLDGVSGQNALSQAREFNTAIALSGLVITKLDGTPKGGIVVAISQELKIPVYYVGVGERADDLIPFSRDAFVAGLIGEASHEGEPADSTGTYGPS